MIVRGCGCRNDNGTIIQHNQLETSSVPNHNKHVKMVAVGTKLFTAVASNKLT
eukprot:m.1665477 g.1665477  ORF g.1665477 m.1665477 type:complete len:53 (+) comp141940_c0_seq1:170-328(+)